MGRSAFPAAPPIKEYGAFEAADLMEGFWSFMRTHAREACGSLARAPVVMRRARRTSAGATRFLARVTNITLTMAVA